jgi:hypothetical protein
VDWLCLTAEFAQTIADYQTACADLLDLSPAAQAVADLEDALTRLDAGAEAGSLPAARVNSARQNLARVLVPLNYTRVPRFRHDPAITCPPLPTLDVASELAGQDDHTRGFALTQAVRGRNRAVAALNAARRIVEDALTG